VTLLAFALPACTAFDGAVVQSRPTDKEQICAEDAARATTCYSCCDVRFAAELKVYDGYIKQFFCDDPGTCKTRCANTICKDADALADEDCSSCLDLDEQRVFDTWAKVEAACTGDTRCQSFQNCNGKCQKKFDNTVPP
jgi:hypothetical protein